MTKATEVAGAPKQAETYAGSTGVGQPRQARVRRGKPLSLVPEAGKDGTTTAEMAPRKAGLFL